MNRRKAIGILAVLVSPMASWRGVSAQGKPTGKASLTIDLNAWAGVTAKLGGQEVHLTTADIMAAFKELND